MDGLKTTPGPLQERTNKLENRSEEAIQKITQRDQAIYREVRKHKGWNHQFPYTFKRNSRTRAQGQWGKDNYGRDSN